jgi:hypothetical protein
MSSPRPLALATLLLAAILALNSVLGPFLLDAIDYGFSETVRNQGIGLDAVSLVVVAPLALFATLLIARGSVAGPPIGLAIGAYSAYMAVQYLVGPNYTVAAHAWPFHLAFFIVAVVVAVGAWTASAGSSLEPTPRLRRLIVTVVVGSAGFVVLRYLPVLLDAFSEEPLPDEYAADPAFFWTIALMDLGLYVPAGVATGLGLLRRAAWAPRAAYAMVAWFVLVTIAVTGMAMAMSANDDPYASDGQLGMFVVLSVLTTMFAGWLFKPLLTAR